MKKLLLFILFWGCLPLLAVQPLLAQTPPAGFTSTVVSANWNEPVGLAFNKTGSKMFVWERTGSVWMVEGGQKKLIINISEEVGAWDDHGLLGFALDPQFETTNYIYLFYVVDRHYLMNFGTSAYSAATNDYYSPTIGRLTRFTVTNLANGQYSVAPNSRKVLIGATRTTGVPSTDNSHVTGSLVFGTDGTLLVATGDGANGGDTDWGNNPGTYFSQALSDGIIRPEENVGAFRSQMLNSLSGKILRIDPATGDGVIGNPFFSPTAAGTTRSKVWAMGFRNPFRMTLKPGTGSTSQSDANPGTLYIVDVGYNTWEEVDVVDRPRQNLGWPLYEGLTPHTPFINRLTANQDAPNPLYNTNGCTQRYFNFQDLVKQSTFSGTAAFPNPCNTSQTIASSTPTFVQTRPLIDWNHSLSGPSRTGTFSGETATTANIGAAGSPVSGPQFGGTAGVGGVFYPHTDFPAEYRDSYFFGDYSAGWMRNMSVTGNTPTAVRDFIFTNSVAVGMAVSPTETGLFYANFYPGEIRKISYSSGANRPPVAVATSNKTYGPSPVAVQFTGSASSDPDGQPLTYLWNFGDGTTSTQINPAHTFTAASASPANFTVTLTVTDTQGSSNQTSLVISANNTPPQVTITSPAAGTLYPLTGNTNYNLRATVTDAEHSSAQLSYQWRTILHHNTHQHPGQADPNPETTTTVSPYGCGSENYYYRITLTVTDAAGLATTKEVRLDPNCTATTFTLVDADSDEDLMAIVPGTVINLAALPSRNLNIRVNANPATTASVVMALSGTATRNQTDSSRPYSLFGDANGNYAAWTPAVGTYSLKATPYSNKGGKGTARPSLTAAFSVVNSTSTPSSYTLTVNTSGNGSVTKSPNQATYSSGTIVSLAATPAAGQRFVGWGTDATGTSNPLSVNMTSNKTITATFEPEPTGTTYAFYRAVNLNGPALTLDGNAWEGSAAANYATNGIPYAAPGVAPLPATDAARAAMLRDFVYNNPGGSVDVTLSAVPAGSYRLYAYLFEDNFAETFDLLVNGQRVLATYNSGPAGTWTRVGPYPVTLAAAGTVQLTAAGGAANLPGIELWRQESGTPPPNQAPVLAAIGNRTATAGQPLAFTATATDPDAGQALTYSLVGSVPAGAAVGASTGDFSWTPPAAGTFTLTLRVADNGSPALSDDETFTVTVGAPPPAGTFAFYRAVNLNGPALTLDGNAWEGSAAANYATNGIPYAAPGVAPLPATDAARAAMLRDFVYNNPGGSVDVTLSAVPAGSYRLYAYLFEDNFAETFDLLVNGQRVLATYNSGPAGTWTRVGPYPVTLAAAGTVQLTAAGGAANLPGIELWRQTTAAARPGKQVLASTPVAQVYPNPSATGTFHVTLPSSFEGEVNYTVVSAVGAEVATGALTVPPQGSVLDLNLVDKAAATGVYYLHLKGKHTQAHLRLMRK